MLYALKNAMARSQGTAHGMAAVLLLPVASILLLQLAGVAAFTNPDNYARIEAFREAMVPRSRHWKEALATWTCPTDPANSQGTCDPCGNSYNGNWAHVHCRGNSRGWGESGDGTLNGVFTNMHITDVQLDGPVAREACILPTLREFDLDGARHAGPFPMWLHRCFPVLEELDLSFNRLTGSLPDYLVAMPTLTEVKAENNILTGTISPRFGEMKLRRFQVEYNRMSGTIPQSFRNVSQSLTQFHIADNDFEGDLSALAGSHLTTVTVHANPKLCGMVPASVRYAVYYNPAGTRLGQPC